MKAYKLEVLGDDEGLCEIVWANTVREAKRLIDGTDLYYERWIDIRATRYQAFDAMEGLSKRDFARESWRHGWQWYEEATPEPEETTDEDFFKWYDEYIGGGDKQ